MKANTCRTPSRKLPALLKVFWVCLLGFWLETFAGGELAPSASTQPAITTQPAAVEKLRWAIDHRFSYRNMLNTDWDAVFRLYGPRLEQAKTPMEFAQTVAEMLGKYAHTSHIWLMVGKNKIYCKTDNGEKKHPSWNFNMRTLKKIVPGWQERNKVVYTGRFEDGIGYIMIRTWALTSKEDQKAAFDALKELIDTKGLILDVRPNGGGSETLAGDFAGCFTDRRVAYAKHIKITDNPEWEKAAPRKRTLKPNAVQPHYRGRVAVLMGPKVVSSCESFLLMMKQIPNCRLFGETSHGGSGNPKEYDLGNGVTLVLPSWKALRMDGTCFEGQGIDPDIRIKTDENDFKKGDPVLDAALQYLRRTTPPSSQPAKLREVDRNEVPFESEED